MIKQAEKAYAPLEVEKQVQEFWNRAKVYAKTVEARSKGDDFYFGDGPPYTTGSIHLGQVLNKTTKDAVIRFRRMRGFRVRDQPGYDMHGLPIEVQVEKTLGITNKKEIEDLGIEKFVATCRTFALDLRCRKRRGVRGEFVEVLLAMARMVATVMGRGGVTACEVTETTTGDKLVGLAYAHPLADKVPYQVTVTGEWVHRVVSSSTVEAEHTGLVHTAPGHGPEDFELGQTLGLPVFSPVDGRGHFTNEAGVYADKPVKEADAVIIEDLRAANALFAAETLVHAYGHCWRCKTPILYRATVQWFLRVTPIKAKMVDEVRRVAWYPEWAGAARQMDWTQNLRDWCLSRQRYWGIPLPIWRCTKCGHWIVVGSSDALRKGPEYAGGLDLQRQ